MINYHICSIFCNKQRQRIMTTKIIEETTLFKYGSILFSFSTYHLIIIWKLSYLLKQRMKFFTFSLQLVVLINQLSYVTHFLNRNSVTSHLYASWLYTSLSYMWILLCLAMRNSRSFTYKMLLSIVSLGYAQIFYIIFLTERTSYL